MKQYIDLLDRILFMDNSDYPTEIISESNNTHEEPHLYHRHILFSHYGFHFETEIKKIVSKEEKAREALKTYKEAHKVFYAFKFRKRVSRVENLRYFYSHLKVLTSDSAPEYVVPETLRLLAWKQSTHNLYNNI